MVIISYPAETEFGQVSLSFPGRFFKFTVLTQDLHHWSPVILRAIFSCTSPFSPRKAGHFDKTDFMQLLCKSCSGMSVLNVRRLVFITELWTQQPSVTLTLSLAVSSREQTSFSLNIFHFQCLRLVSRCGSLDDFSRTLYPGSFT